MSRSPYMRPVRRVGGAMLAALGLTLMTSAPLPALESLRFDQLAGWADDNHLAAFQSFLLTCRQAVETPPKTRALAIDGERLAVICRVALAASIDSTLQARAFFERHFTPRRLAGEGLLTGYYEPALEGSRQRSDIFSVPLLRRPDDLVEIEKQNLWPEGLAQGLTWARRTPDGFEAFPDRGAIQSGALDGSDLELVWLKSAVDAFFIHIQGSATIRLAGGGTMRVSFDGKSGHPYTPIGRVLVERNVMALDDVTMDTIRDWLAAHPEDAPALLATNRSYIFFREVLDTDPDLGPIAAAGVPLSPERSLAVDRKLHTFGIPIWIEPATSDGADRAGRDRLPRLAIAQDTGSAIIGAVRGDLFMGTGATAGTLAGRMRLPVGFVLLVPKASY